MPKLWHDTIAAHRDAVRDATLDATAALVAQHGLTGLTMSQIAQRSGIGRATLYKYFPDLESILAAWHDREITEHLRALHETAQRHAQPYPRLRAVLTSYAQLSHGGHAAGEPAAALHRGTHVAAAHKHLHDFLTELVQAAVDGGEVRADVPAGELATYCVAALTAAADLPSRAARERLVAVTLAGLRPV
jgi:AcrR family transcriptional regulator